MCKGSPGTKVILYRRWLGYGTPRLYGDTVMDREECEPPHPPLTPTGAFSTCHIALTSSRVVQGKCFSLINYYLPHLGRSRDCCRL